MNKLLKGDKHVIEREKCTWEIVDRIKNGSSMRFVFGTGGTTGLDMF